MVPTSVSATSVTSAASRGTSSVTSAASSHPEAAFAWVDEQLQARREAGLMRRPHPRESGEDVLDLAGNDYLGLARDKRVAGAAAAASLRWGAGSTASRLVTGTTTLHTDLERELARFCGFEAALVFSSGFTANVGVVTALTGKQAAIVTDAHVHASLIDGCRLSGAQVAVAGHRDTAAVAHALATRRTSRALVVTDSIFSVDGDAAKLPELATACREHGAGLLVDDAHGFGVLGDRGVGTLPDAGLAGAEDVIATVTLSKALGAQGGAVLGPQKVISLLANTARSFIFDTALAPANVAAAHAALRVLYDEPERPRRCLDAAAELARRLAAAGMRVSTPSAAVLSVRAPTADAALQWAQRCRAGGVAVGCFRPPSVPDGVSRLRLAAHADLTEDDIERAVDVITATAPE